MQRLSQWSTALVVLVAFSLVAGPVLVPREIARWYLAAAQNAYRTKNSVLAEHYLAQAVSWDESVKSDADYWIAQVPAEVQNADQLLDLIEKAVMNDSRWIPKAAEASRVLAEDHDYQRAVRALKIAFLNQRPGTAVGLNQLAYYRSLAGLELEEALKDIKEAISRTIDGADLDEVLRTDRTDRPLELGQYLDTLAWVLHGLGRHLEAIGYVDKAIGYVEQDLVKRGIQPPEPLGQEERMSSLPYASVDVALQQASRRLGMNFTLAVLRFHRLKILQALKRADEAEKDRLWLEERGVPVVDELF